MRRSRSCDSPWSDELIRGMEGLSAHSTESVRRFEEFAGRTPEAHVIILRSMLIARRYLISGRVQGVGFRAFTEAQAAVEGLHGWVRNLPDGTVEVVFEG